jgi:DNA-binding response OmpR family regulator
MRILIADRNETLLEVLQSFLWDRGHEVEIAGTGLECLAILRDFSPDVVVLDRDLLWGGTSGVLAEMQANPELAHLPVILLANEESGLLGELLCMSQVTDWLQKPFRLGDLAELLVTAKQASPRYSVASS